MNKIQDIKYLDFLVGEVDIRNGTKSSICFCPIALSLKRKLRSMRYRKISLTVTLEEIKITEDENLYAETIFNTTIKAQKFIRRFDTTGKGRVQKFRIRRVYP